MFKLIKPKSNHDAGFTIIEVLLAVLVVGLLMAGIAPALVLASASRIQARRLQMGTYASKAFVDAIKIRAVGSRVNVSTGVRTESINTPPPAHRVILPPSANLVLTTLGAEATKIAGPGGAWAGCTTINGLCGFPANQYIQNTATGSLYCFDGDGDNRCTSNSQVDIVVQAVMITDALTTNEITQGYPNDYVLLTRSYRADAFADSTPLKVVSKQGSSGLGDRKAPLVEMRTEILNPGNAKYQDFCTRMGGTAAQCQ